MSSSNIRWVIAKQTPTDDGLARAYYYGEGRWGADLHRVALQFLTRTAAAVFIKDNFPVASQEDLRPALRLILPEVQEP